MGLNGSSAYNLQALEDEVVDLSEERATGGGGLAYEAGAEGADGADSSAGGRASRAEGSLARRS
eukprot:509882-Prymnesium_polylepis.1